MPLKLVPPLVTVFVTTSDPRILAALQERGASEEAKRELLLEMLAQKQIWFDLEPDQAHFWFRIDVPDAPGPDWLN